MRSRGPRPDPGQSRGGQSMLEYTVLVATVTTALALLSNYVLSAFNEHAGQIEDELSGGTEEEK
ncbi:MAG: hypothetical protein COV75_03135 [Candidatus Omnitrophica bacterium CG11_big_fil_rev_8_21_14_0_20_63_9]|nr:MAG: hypothetical protein COV75_03135 [Candidatus Omnitrophica bacterium CG11_big_fil_rev_8_21_14_0_20_63_9]